MVSLTHRIAHWHCLSLSLTKDSPLVDDWLRLLSPVCASPACQPSNLCSASIAHLGMPRVLSTRMIWFGVSYVEGGHNAFSCSGSPLGSADSMHGWTRTHCIRRIPKGWRLFFVPLATVTSFEASKPSPLPREPGGWKEDH